ncbi:MULTISPECIES: adenine phosphoribosyltransferase [unclassified Streptomyces]|jgi:adenine phosphoribosyltransferase|uniref:adenine phosphoribosyltransferase n=1 Tax=unclassified Streptomyces TaxID=2593676 RepID=UPI0036F7A0A2
MTTSHESPAAVTGPGRHLADRIRDIADHPRPGVMFKDITPLLADPQAFSAAVDILSAASAQYGATKIAGLEARGFLLAAPVALRCGAGCVPVRKAGKLPGETLARAYQLEYGTATIEIQRGAFDSDDRVVVVDDVLATGGTAEAAVELIQSTGAHVTSVSVLMELSFLSGRERLQHLLKNDRIHAAITV